ncbi:hypothetical protein M9Y10_025240 [Tritrichomonas musculus]|uniref:F5/8 type C domain-containing protein n=1 Tax=Tritrichomonas musculus TaxID=1915356 RepID=A0ABR2HAV3_9EUKA
MNDFDVCELDIGLLESTHYFIYRKKKYSFNLSAFSIVSELYKRTINLIQQTKDIYLVGKENDNIINISEDAIKDFILICHNIKKPINNENVVAIDYLSNRYEVNKVHEYTQNYISMHENELSFQKYLFYSEQNDFNNIQFEQEIIKNLSVYIDNKQLLELPISSIHRILSNSSKKIDDLNKLKDFLFACLDKYGRGASVLFSVVDLGNLKNECMNLLLLKYSNVFDFHFFTIELYEHQNGQIKEEETIKIQQIKIFDVLQKELNDVKVKQNELLTIIQNQQETIKQLMDSINQITEQTKKHLIHLDFNYNGNNSLFGIIYHLSGECGGNVHDEGIVSITSSSVHGSQFPKYVADLPNNNTGNYFMSANETNSWLQINFKDMKIRPTHYTIRTYSAGPKNYHLKSWIIEGSNNFHENWKVLDSQNSVNYLTYANATYTFEIKEQNPDEYYKLLRIRIAGINDADNFILILSNLEFFGSLVRYQ